MRQSCESKELSRFHYYDITLANGDQLQLEGHSVERKAQQYIFITIDTGYWHQRADERHATLPRGNQELLAVRDKVGRPPGELGVSKSMECDIFPSVL